MSELKNERATALRLEDSEMLNKILVAIDDSTMSRKVFEAGLSLAKRTGASLMLLHVLSSEEKDNPSPFIYSDLKIQSQCRTYSRSLSRAVAEI